MRALAHQPPDHALQRAVRDFDHHALSDHGTRIELQITLDEPTDAFDLVLRYRHDVPVERHDIHDARAFEDGQALIDKMKPGDITPPIRTPAGYQIFKLESQKAAAVQPFDSVRDLISDKVAGARTQTEMRKFLSRLRAQAIIEWKNPELKKEYDKEIAAETGAGGSE